MTGPTGPTQDTKCDCCIEPLENVISQVIALAEAGDSYTIGSLDQNTGGYNNAINLALAGDILTFNVGANRLAVPLCKVTGIAGPHVNEVELMPSVPSTGECACCEEPVTDFISGLASADWTVQGTIFDNIQNAPVVDFGEGIVIINAGGQLGYSAISTCQISEIQNFTFRNTI